MKYFLYAVLYDDGIYDECILIADSELDAVKCLVDNRIFYNWDDDMTPQSVLEFLDSEHNHMDGDSRGYVLLEEIEPIRV